ncbi:hypothetical protein J1N35_002798, partial [Gossypium stocksii]
MDRPIVMGLVVVGGWSVICEKLLVLGMIPTTIFMFSSLRPLYFPTYNKVEQSRKSCRTTEGARRYPATIRSTIGSR